MNKQMMIFYTDLKVTRDTNSKKIYLEQMLHVWQYFVSWLFFVGSTFLQLS